MRTPEVLPATSEVNANVDFKLTRSDQWGELYGLTKRRAVIARTLKDVHKELADLERKGKRVQAKLVRQMLETTSNGRGLLEMVKKTGTSLKRLMA